MSRSSPNYSIAALMKYARREPWEAVLGASMEAHLEPASAETGLSVEEINEELGEDWQGPVFGCAFEHALTLEIEPDGRNLVDDYLKRRGWSESRSNVAYLNALRHSVLSLYLVSEVVPGRSMQLEDILRGGDPVEVIEHSATQLLVQGDVIAARVMEVEGVHLLSGGMLPFRAIGRDDCVLEILREWHQRRDPGDALPEDAQLRELAPLICTRWLVNGLVSSGRAEPPQLLNADGEEMLFHHIDFPLAKGTRVAEVSRLLSAAGWLMLADDGAWLWVPEDGAKAQGETGGVRILGDVTLSQRRLIAQVNSTDRALEIIDRLHELLGDRIGEPDVSVDALEPWLDDDASEDGTDDLSAISVDEAERVVHAALTEHYRATLDMRLPALGGVTPRTAATSEAGRVKVEAWLRSLEEGATKSGGPISTYDFTWLWEALGLRGRHH